MTQTKADFYRDMLRLAFPIALQNLLASCLYMIDTAMVVGLGNVATTAVGVAGRWSFLLNMVYFGLASGSASFIAQYWGAHDVRSIRATHGFTLVNVVAPALCFMVLALVIPSPLMSVFTGEADVIAAGLPFLRIASLSTIAIAYTTVVGSTLRTTERVWIPFITSAVAVVMNTVLNYGLIYGQLGLPALGVKGSALATVISAWTNAVMLTIIAWRRGSVVSAPLKDLFGRWNRAFVRRFYQVVTPVLSNEVLWGVGTNVYVMVLARQGADNYAAYTIFSSVEQLAFVFFVGVCQACAIMVGKAIGAGDMEHGWILSRRFLRLVPLLSLAAGILLVTLRYPIVRLLPIETEYTRLMTAKLLLIYGCWMVMRMVPYIAIVGIFRAGGDTRTGFLFDILNVYLLGIPVTYLLGMVIKVPFEYLFLGMLVAEDTVKVILCLWYYKSRRWIRRLTVGVVPQGTEPSGEGNDCETL